jgi:hypothetical protein
MLYNFLLWLLCPQELTDAAADKGGEEEEEDDLVDDAWEKNLPTSFGSQSQIYGEKIGKVKVKQSSTGT